MGAGWPWGRDVKSVIFLFLRLPISYAVNGVKRCQMDIGIKFRLTPLRGEFMAVVPRTWGKYLIVMRIGFFQG